MNKLNWTIDWMYWSWKQKFSSFVGEANQTNKNTKSDKNSSFSEKTQII